MFPLVEEPDFVLSLGTGEPAPKNYDISTNDYRNDPEHRMIPRARDLVLEKTRDRTLRRAYKSAKLAFKFLHRIHRLSVEFDGTEPRLDDARRIPELISKVQNDNSLSGPIDRVIRCLVASVFYFELDSLPEKHDGKYRISGHIMCSIRLKDPKLESDAFPALLRKLCANSAEFLLDGYPVPGAPHDASSLDAGGNFRKRIEFNSEGKFTISLRQGSWEPCNISGSPFGVSNLVRAQDLDAYFGTPDHGKRKRIDEDGSVRKRRRI